MEKGSKKRKIEITRGIGIKITEDKKGKKNKEPYISENIDRLYIESTDSSQYNPNKSYLKDLKVEIVGIKGNDDTFMNFVRNI